MVDFKVYFKIDFKVDHRGDIRKYFRQSTVFRWTQYES